MDIRNAKVTRTLIVDDGTHVEAKVISLDEVYVPTYDKTSGNNPSRYELDGGNVDDLQSALLKPDWSLPFMIVKPIKGGKEINGKTYLWELVAGFHRFEALSRNLTKEWWFDVYDFTGNPEAESDIQALENDHPPRKRLDKKGIANWLQFQVEKGFIAKTEAAMNKKVDILDFVHHQTKTAAVNMAVSQTGAYKDVTIRSIEEIKDFLEEGDNYIRPDSKDGKVDRAPYVHSGELDAERNEHGWTVKERYENKYIFNAIMSFHKTGKPSYFVNHVSVPKAGTVNDARRKMLKNFKKYEDALETVMKHRQETGEWPWRSESFFKQDNHPDTRETFWVDVESLFPKKDK